MFNGYGPATELMQIYSLTGGFECEDCGFNFIEDPLYFYLDLEHGQIIDALFGMLSSEIDSPIKGWVQKTYCRNCNKHIWYYRIEELNGDYDMEAAYYLLRLLLPRKLDFTIKRLEAYKSIAQKIKSKDLEELEKDLRINRKYYQDLIPELEYGNFHELIDDEEFDIDEYLKVYEMELDRLKNTIYSINLGDEKYNFTLDGEEIAKDICPDCKNTVQEFKFDTSNDKCPRCGGKHILFRIGCNYD